jgi:hypothetical protein
MRRVGEGQETMLGLQCLTGLSLLGLALGLAACSSGAPVDPGAGGGGSETSSGAGGDASTPPANAGVTTFAHLGDQGEILGVGAIVPVKSFEDVPDFDPAFQGTIGIEMPASVRDKTFIQLLRINWLSGGHGPSPYGKPHFDLHFYRGTKEEVDAINCFDTSPFPAEILASGYETPTTCVAGMGYHAWPTADIVGNTFTASIILGYAAQKMVFIEPMVTRELFLARKSFALNIARPASTGGAKTLYPSHLTATYAAATDAYTFELDHFESID